MTQHLIGPFAQAITMTGLPERGALKDDQLQIVEHAGIITAGGKILAVDNFDKLRPEFTSSQTTWMHDASVAIPGLVDCHTHLAWGGSRANDFAARNAGVSYQEIAAAGGGIWSTVTQTRKATGGDLVHLMEQRLHWLLKNGVTTVEIKSGYGLDVQQELKLLRSINNVAETAAQTIVPTCLAAHTLPKDFTGSTTEYLQKILDELVPVVLDEKLCLRFDIFIEEHAFGVDESLTYLQQLREKGFQITVHGDQFTTGGSKVAVEVNAQSVDHLEVSGNKEIALLAKSNTISVALPGATLGLGCPFTPARKLLDAGVSLAIASDWNPGSAPMGDLLTQASILATFEKLSSAEVLAGITTRAADALGLAEKGQLAEGFDADIVSFPTANFKEILYHQGSMKPNGVWTKGHRHF